MTKAPRSPPLQRRARTTAEAIIPRLRATWTIRTTVSRATGINSGDAGGATLGKQAHAPATSHVNAGATEVNRGDIPWASRHPWST